MIRIAELGGEVVDGVVYVDYKTPFPVVCRAGAPVRPHPDERPQGLRAVPICVGRDRAAAEATFLRVHAAGARLELGGPETFERDR